MAQLFNEPMQYDPNVKVKTMNTVNSQSGIVIKEGTGKGVHLLGNSYWRVSPAVEAISQIDNISESGLADSDRYFYVLSRAKTDEQKAAVISLKIKLRLSREKDSYVYFDGTNYHLAKVAIHEKSFLGTSSDPKKLIQNYVNKTIVKVALITPELLDPKINNLDNIMHLVEKQLVNNHSAFSQNEKRHNQISYIQYNSRLFNSDDEDDDSVEDDLADWYEEVDDWMNAYERDLNADYFYWGEYENDFGETCGLVLYEYDLDGDGDMDDTFIEDEYFCETF